jgi:CPA2 family monovalent cation:H+ antiporter-2
VLATLLIIVLGKSVAAYLIVRMFRYPPSTALTISASLAQIGEFSFILAGLGAALALLPANARDLILAGAILSILLNPVFFAMLDRYLAKEKPKPKEEPESRKRASREPIPETKLTDHVVLLGYGRVGRFIAPRVIEAGIPLLVIDTDAEALKKLNGDRVETIRGNAVNKQVIAATNLAQARCLLVAVPDAFEGGFAVELGRKANPELTIIARSHSEEETAYLMKHGATDVIMGEHEIAKAMIAAIPPRRDNTALAEVAGPEQLSADSAPSQQPA